MFAIRNKKLRIRIRILLELEQEVMVGGLSVAPRDLWDPPWTDQLFLKYVAMPFALSSVLAPSSTARSP